MCTNTTLTIMSSTFVVCFCPVLFCLLSSFTQRLVVAFEHSFCLEKVLLWKLHAARENRLSLAAKKKKKFHMGENSFHSGLLLYKWLSSTS